MAGTPVPAEYCFLVTSLPPSSSPPPTHFFLSHKKKAQVFYIHFVKSCVAHTNWRGFLLLEPFPFSEPGLQARQAWAQPLLGKEGQLGF